MAIIKVQNLVKEFKSYERGEGFLEAIKSLVKRKVKIFKAVDDIGFEIEKGDVVGFLGPNGAGKSTTIKMLSGVMYPDSGLVKVKGYVPWKERKEYVKHIGVVFGQKSQLFWDLPPIDSFYMHKGIYSLSEKAFDKELNKLVELLGVGEVMKRPTRQLSLGERMRCEFVMAMLHKPKIVFLDEPTIGLDLFAKETIRKFIKQVNQEEGTTFIVTSHDLEDIEHLCDRVIIINEGKIVFNDVVSKLKPEKRKYVLVKFYKVTGVKELNIIKGVKVVKKLSAYAFKLEVNTSEIALSLLIKKLAQNNIEDIEVYNPPITDMIKKLYKS